MATGIHPTTLTPSTYSYSTSDRAQSIPEEQQQESPALGKDATSNEKTSQLANMIQMGTTRGAHKVSRN